MLILQKADCPTNLNYNPINLHQTDDIYKFPTPC